MDLGVGDDLARHAPTATTVVVTPLAVGARIAALLTIERWRERADAAVYAASNEPFAAPQNAHAARTRRHGADSARGAPDEARAAVLRVGEVLLHADAPADVARLARDAGVLRGVRHPAARLRRVGPLRAILRPRSVEGGRSRRLPRHRARKGRPRPRDAHPRRCRRPRRRMPRASRPRRTSERLTRQGTRTRRSRLGCSPAARARATQSRRRAGPTRGCDASRHDTPDRGPSANPTKDPRCHCDRSRSPRSAR